MKLSSLLTVAGVIGLLFGVVNVLLTAPALAQYGVVDPPEAMLYSVRFFGAALINLGLISLLLRHTSDSQTRRALVLGGLVGDGIGFVASLIGQLAGAVNALGWLTVVIYLALGLGFAYFYFMKPEG
ncbi:MAG: hypothetical protein AB1791_05580 [Chloroflexota bacterium]